MSEANGEGRMLPAQHSLGIERRSVVRRFVKPRAGAATEASDGESRVVAEPTPGTVKSVLSLSSNSLKLIACATMLIDHAGFLFFPDDLIWRIIGRTSFPIFAFLVAEGYGRTSSLRNYFFRLLALSVVSQLPYVLFRLAADGTWNDLNIFFTLSAGLFAIMLWDKLPAAAAIPSIAAVAGLAYVFSFDYGGYGVFAVLLSRLVFYHRSWGLAALVILPQIPVVIRFLLGVLSLQTFAAMSVPLIALYNGERGRHIPKYLFYGFYPVHLLMLWLISLLLP